MKNIISLLVIIVPFIASCSMEGKLSDKKNKLIVCKDSRDGSTFAFNTNTVKNIRIGVGAPSAFDVVTIEGKKRTLVQSEEVWTKCQERKASTGG